MALAVQSSRIARVETVDRWVRAFGRALDSGVDAVEMSNGDWLIPSASNHAVSYTVSPDGHSCTCQAAASGDRVCWHRAMVRFFNGNCPGVENTPEADPAPVSGFDADTLAFASVFTVTRTAPAPVVTCGLCHGRGFTEVYGPTGRLNDYEDVTCWHCGGSGVEPRRHAA